MPAVIRELIPPPDPLEACERLEGRRERIFFDSARGGTHSYIAADPWTVLHDPRELREILAASSLPPVEGLPPFQGGAAGRIEYEWDGGMGPAFRFGLYDWVLAWDHGEDRAWLVSTGMPERGEAARRRARARASEVERLLSREGHSQRAERPSGSRPISNFEKDGYIKAVQDILGRISRGELSQVNLSQRFEAKGGADPWALYRSLRAFNPAPFATYYEWDDQAIASASPERYVRLSGRRVESWPIKGTRPRGATLEEDRRLEEELLHSEKDRDENRLTVDALRVELEPLCSAGTVRVERFCALEKHPTVQHLVSEVSGELRGGLDPLDLLLGTFPPASITGSPKAKAMEAIAELEAVRRGAYCGAVAWWSFGGAFDSNVLIRTLWAQGDRVSFSAGGGIVAGSDPEEEWGETLHKAYALLHTLEEAR